jgi:hypothetical protein
LSYQIDSVIIVAGIDSMARIFKIVNPGKVIDFGLPCFAAIGIGQSHAESQLMLAGFDKQWSAADTIFLVYSAKTRAEAAAGVGSATDVAIIGQAGIHQATQEEVEKLRKIFDDKEKRDSKSWKDAYANVGKYLDDLRSKSAKPESEQKAPPET